MTEISVYEHIRSGGGGFYRQKRALIAVWGKEAVQFLDGMISNDMKTLEDGQQMLAAFPNAQGRLLGVVRVLRNGERFLIETEEATREKLYQSLFRFTFAGDFFVEDLSDKFRYFEVFGIGECSTHYDIGVAAFRGRGGSLLAVTAQNDSEDFREKLVGIGAVELNAETYETLRIENGIPIFGVDMDETTIVPELGLDGLISYNKGCYIGQEIIARIHFRGHIAKQLTGLIFNDSERIAFDASSALELQSPDGKNAGRITSATYSPKLGKQIAIGYARYDFLAPGTELLAGERTVKVATLPFI